MFILLISDGQIVSFAPRLPIRASMAFPVVSSTVRDRHLPVRAAARSADAADLLSRAALGEVTKITNKLIVLSFCLLFRA